MKITKQELIWIQGLVINEMCDQKKYINECECDDELRRLAVFFQIKYENMLHLQNTLNAILETGAKRIVVE